MTELTLSILLNLIQENEKIEKKELAQTLLKDLAVPLLSYTDESKEFAIACGEAGLTDLLLQILSELQDCVPSHVPFVVSNGIYLGDVKNGQEH